MHSLGLGWIGLGIKSFHVRGRYGCNWLRVWGIWFSALWCPPGSVLSFLVACSQLRPWPETGSSGRAPSNVCTQVGTQGGGILQLSLRLSGAWVSAKAGAPCHTGLAWGLGLLLAVKAAPNPHPLPALSV